MYPIQSILAATDLDPSTDAALHAAADLAERTGATLHVVYVAPLWATDDEDEKTLDAQLRRVLGDAAEDVDVAIVRDRAFHGILVQAAAVAADLIVLGPHRGTTSYARVSGTTAERVVRSADVPCLVVRGPMTFPLQTVGVLTDFSPRSRGASDLMAEWLPVWQSDAPGEAVETGAASRLHLVHVATRADASREAVDARLAHEVERITSEAPGAVDVTPVALHGTGIVDAVRSWSEAEAANLLVLTTTARTGLDRLWNGSRATTLATTVPCSVLIVPPSLWRRAALPLSRIAVAIDRDAADGAAWRWVEQRAQQAQRPLEWIALDNAGPDADPLPATREADADLLVIHETRTPGRYHEPVDPWVERVLESTHVPVMVLRDFPGDIESILVAVDTGELWYEKFAWAKLLADRFDAHVTIFHAVDLSLRSRVRRVPGGEFVSGASLWMKHDIEHTVVPAMRAWLWERVRLSGLQADRVDVILGLQDPWYAIPALAERTDADIVIVAAHQRHEPGREPLSAVARDVLEGGHYTVLAVVDRYRRDALTTPDVSTLDATTSDRAASDRATSNKHASESNASESSTPDPTSDAESTPDTERVIS